MITVLITGAASGIGSATALRLAEPGCNLLLHSRINQHNLNQVADRARSLGANVETALGDLTDPDIADSLVNICMAKFSSLDQIVNNAGFANRGEFGDTDVETLINAQKGMPEAFFRIASAAIPHISQSHIGRVVVVSSFVSHVFAAGGIFTATAAAKASLEALAKSLAVQLAPAGITVNCIAPGYTRKDESAHSAIPDSAWLEAVRRIPLNRIGTPDDSAALISFLLSPDAGFITGQTIHVDGGLTLA